MFFKRFLAFLVLIPSLALAGPWRLPGTVLAADGTVSLPTYSFQLDEDSGLYRIGANNLGIGVNGAKVLDIGTAGLGVTGTLGVSGQSTFTGGFAPQTISGAVTWSSAQTWESVGTFTGTGGVSRGDAQIEFYNVSGTGHAMLAGYMTQNPPNTTNEVALSAQAKNSAGNIVQIGAFYARWNDTDSATGYSVVGMHSNWDGGGSGQPELEVFGNHGIVMFGGTAATPPGFLGLRLDNRTAGRPNILGESDVVIDANYGGAADRVFLNAYNAGPVSLANAGGDVEIGPIGSEYAKVTSSLFEVNTPFRIDNATASQEGTSNTTQLISTTTGWVRQLMTPASGSSSYFKTTSDVSHVFLNSVDTTVGSYTAAGNWTLTPSASSTLQVEGYTALGDNPGSASGQNPYVKIKTLRGTWATSVLGRNPVAHGLTSSKIITAWGYVSGGSLISGRTYSVPGRMATTTDSADVAVEWDSSDIALTSFAYDSATAAAPSFGTVDYVIVILYEN